MKMCVTGNSFLIEKKKTDTRLFVIWCPDYTIAAYACKYKIFNLLWPIRRFAYLRLHESISDMH